MTTVGKAWMESDASLLREQDTQERLQEVMIKCEGLESKEVKKQDDTSEWVGRNIDVALFLR